MEKEIENLKKIHEQDVLCLQAMSEEIEQLKNELENKKLQELENEKIEIEKKLADERYRLFMNQPRQPIIENEQNQQPKQRTLDEILLED